MEMIRRRNGQRSLWDAVLFGAPDPRTLMEPKLRVVDELLNDDALVDNVLEAMRGRFAQSGRLDGRGCLQLAAHGQTPTERRGHAHRPPLTLVWGRPPRGLPPRGFAAIPPSRANRLPAIGQGAACAAPC